MQMTTLTMSIWRRLTGPNDDRTVPWRYREHQLVGSEEELEEVAQREREADGDDHQRDQPDAALAQRLPERRDPAT